MKIEKKKITGIKSISLAAKSTLAATLGMLGALTLNACDDSTSAKDDNTNSTGDIVTNPDSVDSPVAGTSSSQAEEQQGSSSQAEKKSSSSGKIVDIPLSQEPISSSVIEAISSLMESSSSEAAPASSSVAQASSTAEAASSANEPASSTAEPASSTDTQESSSDQPASSETTSSSSWNNAWGSGFYSSTSVTDEQYCGPSDPHCINYQLCEGMECMMGSMVTTFERDDIES